MTRRLPIRRRLRFALARRLAGVLRVLGLREAAIALRDDGARRLRTALERRGSARLSHPALHQMDRKLDAIIDRDGGFFVEAGGFDGYTQSNTYYLERFRGWRGMLVEPMPELAACARRNRPDATVFQCALVARDHPEPTIDMQFGDLMTTVSSPVSREWVAPGLIQGWRDHRIEAVRARTLSELLDELGGPPVDLLSLDIEGYEAAALGGLDLDRHAPAWILVEMHDLAVGRAAVEPLLHERYVEHAQLSPLDVLYRRRDVTVPGAAPAVR